MIYLTGDTHIPIDVMKLHEENWKEQVGLTRSDYLIILGDFGLYWKEDETFEHWMDWFGSKPFTTLWIDGNHENHAWINSLPVSEWHGGKVHRSLDNLIHLMRGEIYDIDGKMFLAAGGADSIDKNRRIVGETWWEEEQWSYRQQQTMAYNLEQLRSSGGNLDFVLSHTCPNNIIMPMFGIRNCKDPVSRLLQMVADDYFLEIEGWYFGHWHADKDFGRFHCLYHEVRRLDFHAEKRFDQRECI